MKIGILELQDLVDPMDKLYEIFGLPFAFIVLSLALPYSTKIKSQDTPTQSLGLLERMLDDLIFHATPHLRMRVGQE